MSLVEGRGFQNLSLVKGRGFQEVSDCQIPSFGVVEGVRAEAEAGVRRETFLRCFDSLRLLSQVPCSDVRPDCPMSSGTACGSMFQL